MNPHRVRATNLRSYPELDVEFPTGCVALVGPNGAGKSTLIEAVRIALFGGKLSDLLMAGEEELQLELTFEHGGELYRIRRSYSARGRGKTSLDFERFEMADFTPLTRETATATQDAICQLLGLSETTYAASAHLSQGEGGNFAEAQPRDRKAVLAEILNLAIWDRLLERTRTELRGLEDDHVKVTTQIAGARELAEQRPTITEGHRRAAEAVAEASTTLADAERELEQAVQELAAARVAGEKVRACEAEHRAATETHERARVALAEAVAAGEQLADRIIELGEVTADADQVPELEARLGVLAAAALEGANLRHRLDELSRAIEQRELARDRMVDQAVAMHVEVKALLAKSDHLEAHIGESEQCDRCGQTLGAEAADRARKSYLTDANELHLRVFEVDRANEEELAAIDDLRGQRDAIVVPAVEDPKPVELQLRAARGAAIRRAELGEVIRQLTEKSEHRPGFEAALYQAAEDANIAEHQLDKAREHAVDETPLIARVERWRIAIAEGRTILERRQADVVRHTEHLERITAADEQLVELAVTVERMQRHVDVLKLAERAFGRDGIPALILESSAIPMIEIEANRILEELGTRYRVELRTQSQNKSNANLRETLDVIVLDDDGSRPYETFSGGEKTRINLALRLALAGLLANRRGAESRLLAIDELDGLDAAGMDRLVDVLRRLGETTFDRILLVSHQQQLAHSFDQVIEIAKVDGHSVIVGDREPVAA